MFFLCVVEKFSCFRTRCFVSVVLNMILIPLNINISNSISMLHTDCLKWLSFSMRNTEEQKRSFCQKRGLWSSYCIIIQIQNDEDLLTHKNHQVLALECTITRKLSIQQLEKIGDCKYYYYYHYYYQWLLFFLVPVSLHSSSLSKILTRYHIQLMVPLQAKRLLMWGRIWV